MYDVRIDQVKNRLYIIISGFLSIEEAEQVSDAIRAGIDQLKPGFDFITDMQGFKPGSSPVTKFMGETLTYAEQRGLKRSVQIISKNIIGQMQVDRVSREKGVELLKAASLEEAEALLDG